MNVWGDIQVRSHYYHRKAKIIIYYEGVFVALFIQHAKLMIPTIPHYLINWTIFWKRYWTQNEYLDLVYTFVWNISHSKKNWAKYDQKCILVSM